ncbi:HEAT repeat domain-containing protein [Melittangium boletus]|uniref:PBS lyase n=1 Tax=Melittangium boletus DSM 14713 TaxID=1294270 RepID=A0A250II11_9BACT|nr:HEAT repeat domain-containing protein [Melittangium boletus]ATB31464.1 PBS lyase [Melittangium boletus DSM 14713]
MKRLLTASCLSLALLVSGCEVDPSSPEHWGKRLGKARRTQDKIRVVETLRSSGRLTAAFLPLLHEQLGPQHKAELRASVVRALGDMKEPASLEPLTRAVDLGATDPATHQLNKEVALALGGLGDARAIPVLLRLLGSTDPFTRIAAVESLGALRAREAVEPLCQLALDDEVAPFLNRKAIEALGRIGDARAVPTLVRTLTKERQGLTFYTESAFSLFQVGAPSGDALLEVLEGRDAGLSSKAAQVLGDLRDHRAEGALLRQLAFTHEQPQVQVLVRTHAADALARLRAAAAVKPLAAMLSDPEPDVLPRYAFALARLGGREALPALEKAAEERSGDAREAALQALTMLGDARELPVLERLAALPSKCPPCEEDEASAQRKAEVLAGHRARLAAAKECGTQTACWAGKLGDSEPAVVERAALEVGRSHSAAHVGALLARVTEKNPETRAALLLAASWLLEDAQDARVPARSTLPTLERQLSDEKGRMDYARVNEELRRLVVRLR